MGLKDFKNNQHVHELQNHVIAIKYITNIVRTNELTFCINFISGKDVRFQFEKKEDCQIEFDTISDKMLKCLSK